MKPTLPWTRMDSANCARAQHAAIFGSLDHPQMGRNVLF
jgi:hypothetical protein